MPTEAKTTHANYFSLAKDTIASLGIAYAAIEFQKVERDPILAAQIPSFLVGRMGDGMIAMAAVPFIGISARLYIDATNFLGMSLPQHIQAKLEDIKIHMAASFGLLTLWELSQGPLRLAADSYSSSTFDWGDIVAYGIGTAMAFGLHKVFYRSTPQPHQ